MILIAGDSFGQIPKEHGLKDTDHWYEIYARRENLEFISIAEPGADLQKTIFDTVKYISDNNKNAYAIKECIFFATSPYRLHRNKTRAFVNYGEWHRPDVHFKGIEGISENNQILNHFRQMCAGFDSDGYDKLNINIIKNHSTDLNYFTEVPHYQYFSAYLGNLMLLDYVCKIKDIKLKFVFPFMHDICKLCCKILNGFEYNEEWIEKNDKRLVSHVTNENHEMIAEIFCKK